MYQSLSHWAAGMPCLVMPKMSAPRAAPIAEPYPPVSRHPPMTAAMMYSNSWPMPRLAWTEPERAITIMPTTQPQNETPMNSRTLTRPTGTPT